MKSSSLVAAGVAALAGVAVAVPPNPAPPISTGPDVVVSGIGSSSGSSPYGDSSGGSTLKNGTVGSISAWSVGTISCNIGNANAIWIAGDNRHPVIGTQIYRFRNVNGANQLDLVGINWLKHGWCAADGQNCTQLTNPPGTQQSASGCNFLGPFATDTYSSSLNADQTDLGPRFEVNPWTGVFPYPYTLSYNQTGDNIFKRTQVPHSDLVPATNYIFEVVYIATDEPVANRYNNYSYRLGTMSGSGATATFSLTGPTQAMQTIIDAWVALESGVTKTIIDPSGTTDGRLILGHKVTQTGPSTWHYEYVLQNMNNHAAVRSFSLPMDSNVVLTNVGFKDVAYHSGEPISGTDWTFSNDGGVASWSTQTFAQNPNANAIYWSTAYSFRFDANVAPTTGTLTLGMFRTGASVNVSNIQIPSAPPPPTPGPFALTSPVGGATTANNTPTLLWGSSSGALTYNLRVAADNAFNTIVANPTGLTGTSWGVPPATLLYNTEYWWGVEAFNGAGSTLSTPRVESFRTPPSPCAGDADLNGTTNTLDLTILLGTFGSTVPPGTGADFDGNGSINTADLTLLLGGFGCVG